MTRILTIEERDDNIVKVLEVKTDKGIFVLEGECKRCGACCRVHNCEYLYFENVNDVRLATCRIEGEYKFGKPWGCKIYPRDPEEPLHEGCGYKWVKKS